MYEREVQSLQQRIARNEEMVQRLQEKARIEIVRLRDDYEAAAKKRKLELDATFGRTVPLTVRNASTASLFLPMTERLARLPTPSPGTPRLHAVRVPGSNHRRPRAPTDPTAAQRINRRNDTLRCRTTGSFCGVTTTIPISATGQSSRQ
jgi:hypothetical protein